MSPDDLAEPGEVVIKVREDGPYKVTGPVRIVDAAGRAYALPEGPIALCRCGRSQDKPFCDGSHKGTFAAAPPDVRP